MAAVRAWVVALENDRGVLRPDIVAAGAGRDRTAAEALDPRIDGEEEEEVDRAEVDRRENHPVEVLFQIHQAPVHRDSSSSKRVHCRFPDLCHSSFSTTFVQPPPSSEGGARCELRAVFRPWAPQQTIMNSIAVR